ncbi:MAG TPA: bifunctional metallophosphatase/5'-nucleotidase [Rhodocyclaceae bacterium]|nr:bifunctional metallophosphatase/5'-nucleotidase [Rhodocyclaceae bacterium]
MKKQLLALLLSSASAFSAQAATMTVRLIAFNDFHGNLMSPGNFAGKPAGGADYLAGYVAKLKKDNPNNVVVGAGDLIGASPLGSALLHDEASIEVLNRIGLEFSAVGNHEFDEGFAELLRMQNGGCSFADPANSCKGAQVGTPVPFEGAKFRYLAANVVFNATGKTLFAPFAIKSFKDAASGKSVRVGFIGLTLKDTPSIVTPSGVAGLRFDEESATINALVPKLRAQGVEAIVVLLHQGTNAAASDINGCASGAGTEPLRSIVAKLDDHVDMVVSGHSHLSYNCRFPNLAGRNIPVTQASAFGRVLTQADLTLDVATGDVLGVYASNIVVDRSDASIQPIAQIADIMAKYNALVAPLANVVIGSITQDLPNSGDEMPAGDLIADAQLDATRAPAPGAAQIALMNRGGVRSPGFVFNQSSGGEVAGDVTYGEAFTVQPFGNILQTLTLTAQQLKDVLEQQFAGCQLPGEPMQTTDRIMQISKGLRYSWSASVPASSCSRITTISFNGAPLYGAGGFVAPYTAATPLQVTVNNFMASGGDGFSVLTHGLNPIGGGQDLDALVSYLANFKAPHAPYSPSDPALQTPRITKLP